MQMRGVVSKQAHIQRKRELLKQQKYARARVVLEQTTAPMRFTHIRSFRAGVVERSKAQRSERCDASLRRFESCPLHCFDLCFLFGVQTFCFAKGLRRKPSQVRILPLAFDLWFLLCCDFSFFF